MVAVETQPAESSTVTQFLIWESRPSQSQTAQLATAATRRPTKMSTTWSQIAVAKPETLFVSHSITGCGTQPAPKGLYTQERRSRNPARLLVELRGVEPLTS